MRPLTAKVFYCTCAEFFFFFFLLPLCFVYFAAHSHLFFFLLLIYFPGYREIASSVRCSLNSRVFFGFELGCTAFPVIIRVWYSRSFNTSSSYLYSSTSRVPLLFFCRK